MSSAMADRLRTAVDALASGTTPAGPQPAKGTTSDLTIDEVLMLDSVGWEPVDMVFGLSWWSIPWGVWQYQTGEIAEASSAFASAMNEASSALHAECTAAGGDGVVGVNIEFRVQSHHVDIALTGTAVRPVGGTRPKRANGAGRRKAVFVSDLSARDFTLLLRSGWWPVGLVAGASFVVAPRRSARQWASQQGQNVELTNLTEALYQAREGAMARMQEMGLAQHADGVIGVKLREGPLGRGARAMQFVAVGTAVRLDGDTHRHITPTMVLPLNDAVNQFEVASLRSPR
jgi:uncharacterized protein YbjQ (UPF0145 family)